MLRKTGHVKSSDHTVQEKLKLQKTCERQASEYYQELFIANSELKAHSVVPSLDQDIAWKTQGIPHIPPDQHPDQQYSSVACGHLLTFLEASHWRSGLIRVNAELAQKPTLPPLQWE